MNASDKRLSESRAIEMRSYEPKNWAATLRELQAKRIAAVQKEIVEAAIKSYLLSIGKDRIEAGGHIVSISMKAGSPRLDSKALYAELRAMGVDIDSLVEKHTHRGADVPTLNFK